MPALSPRKPVHTRSITINAYRREDGLTDIETVLTDTKPYPFTLRDRGEIQPGEPLHLMLIHLTVDQALVIQEASAEIRRSPYTGCPAAADSFALLKGLQIAPGFHKAVAALTGHTKGCTHLREVLQQVATVAYQAAASEAADQAEGKDKAASLQKTAGEALRKKIGSPQGLLNSCLSYASDGPVVKRRWPELYTGPEDSLPEGNPADKKDQS